MSKKSNPSRDTEPPRTVYSTQTGDLRKSTPSKQMVRSLPPREQTIYLHRESKGRGGKTVTLVRGLQLNPEDLAALASELKQACGAGGTVKEGIIEIQGDRRERIATVLGKIGYKVKIAGG